MPLGNTHGATAGVPDGIIETAAGVLEDAAGPVYVIDPPERITRGMIGAVSRLGESSPDVRLLGRGKMLRRIRRDFLAASEAASLVADGHLELRTEPPDGEARLITTEDSVHAVVTASGVADHLQERESTFVEEARETCERLWADGESFGLHTPGIDWLTGEMTASFGPQFGEQFTESLDVARGMRDRSEFDPVTATVLIAAHNEELHYDVSKLGEDTGLASKATFSRIKNQLEDDGIIDTEKVKVEMGRPRQRLELTPQYRELADQCGVTELVAHITN